MPKIFIHWVNFSNCARKPILAVDEFVSTFSKYIFMLVLKFLYAQVFVCSLKPKDVA